MGGVGARGDLAAMLEVLSPDMVTHVATPIPLAGTYHGREGLLQASIDWAEAFDDWPSPRRVHRRRRRVVSVLLHKSAARRAVHCRSRLAPRVGRGDRRGEDSPRGSTLTTTEASRPRSRGAVGVGDVAGERGDRAGLRAWSDGDLDALLAVSDAEIELRTSGAFPEVARSIAATTACAPSGSRCGSGSRFTSSRSASSRARIARPWPSAPGAGQGQRRGEELRQGHALWLKDGRVVKVPPTVVDEALEAVGSRSRRCLRRTWRYRGGSWRPSTGATGMPGSR